MQSNMGFEEEGTLLQEEDEEKREDMETDSFLRDNLGFDVESKVELYYKTYEGKELQIV